MQYWTDGRVPAPGFNLGLEIRVDQTWRMLAKVPARNMPVPLLAGQRPIMWAEDSDGSVVFWPRPDRKYLVRVVDPAEVIRMAGAWKGMAGPGSGEGVAAFAQRLNDSANKAAAKDAQDRGLPKPIPIVVKSEEPEKLPQPNLDIVLIKAAGYGLKPHVQFFDGSWRASVQDVGSPESTHRFVGTGLSEMIEWLDRQVNEAIYRLGVAEVKVDHAWLLETLRQTAEIISRPGIVEITTAQARYILAHLQKPELPNAPS